MDVNSYQLIAHDHSMNRGLLPFLQAGISSGTLCSAAEYGLPLPFLFGIYAVRIFFLNKMRH